MASGVTSGAWGYSMNQLAGITNIAEMNGVPLTYQLGLTSTPSLPSPLLAANKSFYNVPSFGKRKKVKSILRDIRLLKKN